MPRTHGYARKGSRCYGDHDCGSKGRTNAIGALLGGILLTVSLFETIIKAVIFTQWVIQDLSLSYHRQVLLCSIMQSFARGVEIINALETCGHTVLYLPPYPPDLNPIEKKGSQAKSRRRKLQCPIETLFLEQDL